MSDRQLHPVQKQYLETKDKIACLEVAMLPMKNEMKLLKKQLREAEAPLTDWLKRHFPDSYDMMGNYARIDMALHIDASTIPDDETELSNASKQGSRGNVNPKGQLSNFSLSQETEDCNEDPST